MFKFFFLDKFFILTWEMYCDSIRVHIELLQVTVKAFLVTAIVSKHRWRRGAGIEDTQEWMKGTDFTAKLTLEI